MIKGESKYQFIFSLDGEGWFGINPSKAITISGSLDERCADHRRSSSEWKINRYMNKGAYDLIIAAIQNPSELTSRIQVRIELWDDYATRSSIEFEGYMPLAGVKVNENDGTISFTPVDNSKYAWWDEHKTDQKDVLALGDGDNTITYETTSRTVEFWLDGTYGGTLAGFEWEVADPDRLS